LRRSRIAVLLSTISVTVNLVLSVVLVRWIGFRGLALATSLAAIVHGTLALGLLRRRLGPFGGGQLAMTLAKVVVGSALMALIVAAVMSELSVRFPGETVPTQLLRLAVAIGSGLVTVAVSAKLLRIPEFDEVVSQIRHRLTRDAR
jgi:putative peptidoglycan lipid II flippase